MLYGVYDPKHRHFTPDFGSKTTVFMPYMAYIAMLYGSLLPLNLDKVLFRVMKFGFGVMDILYEDTVTLDIHMSLRHILSMVYTLMTRCV